MPLDTTVAGAATDSYISLAEADAFADADPVNGAAWLAAGDPSQETSLRAATVDVDLYKRAVGVAYATTQARLYPRAVDIDSLDVPFILADVKRATYEQAVYLLRNAKLIADAAARRARALFNFSDDDGSGQPALNSSFGLYAPKMIEYLDRIGSTGRAFGRTIVSVPMTSSYE